MVYGESFKHQQSRIAHSAGGVCYRVQDGQLLVVLIATQRSTRWGLPKGQVSKNEKPADAARRELEEETGITGAMVQPLDTIEYWFRSGSSRIHKFVDLFLFRYESGSISPQLTEVDDARWIPLDQAIEQVSFPRERAVLEKVRRLWQNNELA